MKLSVSYWLNRRVMCLALTAAFVSSSVDSFAQKTETDSEAEKSAELEGETEEEVDDRFVVPTDADVTELKKFIKETKELMSTARSRKEFIETYSKVHQAVLDAATAGIEQATKDDDVSRFVIEKFDSYRALARLDDSKSEEAIAFAKLWISDSRPEFAAVAEGFLLTQKLQDAMESEELANEVATDVISYVDKYGANNETLAVAQSIASALDFSEFKSVAATVYEQLGERFIKADGESLKASGENFVASARRMNLEGNSMKVFGTTADGEEFDWDSYRGKVVLVDFWASWCGPCLSELPNMKRNVEEYGDRGFVIVGINMDNMPKAMTDCVEDKGISWVNIFPEDEAERGWKAPMATYYGIRGIPTAILVDKEGKVVSLNARGKNLDEALASLLGPPEDSKVESDDESDDAGLR